MRIAIDIREALKPVVTGKGKWTEGLLRELLTRDIDLSLFTDRALPSWARTSRVEEVLISMSGIAWHLRAARLLTSRLDSSVMLCPTSYIIPAFLPKKIKTAVVVHDLIAYLPEPHLQRARWIERLTLPLALRKASTICVISEATKSDLLARFPAVDQQKIRTIYAGPLRETVQQNASDGHTILCIATLCPRKNQLRLIEAYASLPESLHKKVLLVLCGARGWQDAEILRAIERTPGVTWKQYVSDEEYERLLATCAVFALPSLYEGFGMQILDALQRGIPVLTSDRGSLREVAGDAAFVVDPEDVQDIARGLETLLTNEHLREALRTKGPTKAHEFSWKRTADLLLESLS